MKILFQRIAAAVRTARNFCERMIQSVRTASLRSRTVDKRIANGKRTVLRRPERIAVVYVFAGEVKCYVSSQGTWKFPCTCHMFHRKEHGNFHVPCHMFHLKVHGKCHVPCQGICFVARYMEISMFPAGFAFHMRYLWKKSCSLR